ncbi:hypothetical protein M0D21_06665 [Aquimarina sp. D1M17]|uniref:hypothetical protein n=1 Tax=Aquimarina acroporae TaxID=2937283 RepID=UPI0020C15B50|nr:hypothetical protein [Aquimarina acroporae]MCK8521239.1 hypothetical protein [Aquimarina acroporae]
MIKVFFTPLLVLSFYFGFSQKTKKVSVEKSVFGIQTGLLGIWAHNELKLSSQIALRSEIGFGGLNTSNIRPVLALEPRWYYNLQKRADKDKRVDGNSGNYISLRARYHFHSTEDAEKSDLYHLLTVATWGIRRNIGKHFNYEAGIGTGFGFEKGNSRDVVTVPYVAFGIGYRF